MTGARLVEQRLEREQRHIRAFAYTVGCLLLVLTLSGLAVMLVLTLDVQAGSDRANAERRHLTATVDKLREQIGALETQLRSLGITPATEPTSPSSTPSPAAAGAAHPTPAAGSAPAPSRTRAPSPTASRSPRPSPSSSSSPSPRPSPSPTCVRLPVVGCLP